MDVQFKDLTSSYSKHLNHWGLENKTGGERPKINRITSNNSVNLALKINLKKSINPLNLVHSIVVPAMMNTI